MALSLVRIDDRLVHGQVVEGWIPHLKAELLLVVSDEAAKDETVQTLMRLAVPDAVELVVASVAEAARHPVFMDGSPKRTLVVAPGPVEVLGLLEKGVRFPTVNVGGLHYTAGKVQLGKAIYLSAADRKALMEISKRGVVLEGRALPGDPREDLLEMILAEAAA